MKKSRRNPVVIAQVIGIVLIVGTFVIVTTITLLAHLVGWFGAGVCAGSPILIGFAWWGFMRFLARGTHENPKQKAIRTQAEPDKDEPEEPEILGKNKRAQLPILPIAPVLTTEPSPPAPISSPGP